METHLDYAPPVANRLHNWRRYVIAVVLLTLLGSSYSWWPLARHRMQVMYWQNRCMNYSAPPERVVLEWQSLKQTAVDVNIPWRQYQQFVSGVINQSGACVFLHEIHRPDGKARLLCIKPDVQFYQSSDETYLAMWADLYEPGSLGRNPSVINLPGFDSIRMKLRSDLKLFAGQLDAGSPSHITIEFDIDGQHKTIDGWLDNNDRLLMVQRP